MKKTNILISIFSAVISVSTISAFKDFTPYFQGDGRDSQGQNLLHQVAEECEVSELFEKAKNDFMTKHFNDTEIITIRLTVDGLVDLFNQKDHNGETPIDIASRKFYKNNTESCEKILEGLLLEKYRMQQKQKAGEGKMLLLGKDDD